MTCARALSSGLEIQFWHLQSMCIALEGFVKSQIIAQFIANFIAPAKQKYTHKLTYFELAIYLRFWPIKSNAFTAFANVFHSDVQLLNCVGNSVIKINSSWTDPDPRYIFIHFAVFR